MSEAIWAYHLFLGQSSQRSIVSTLFLLGRSGLSFYSVFQVIHFYWHLPVIWVEGEICGMTFSNTPSYIHIVCFLFQSFIFNFCWSNVHFTKHIRFRVMCRIISSGMVRHITSFTILHSFLFIFTVWVSTMMSVGWALSVPISKVLFSFLVGYWPFAFSNQQINNVFTIFFVLIKPLFWFHSSFVTMYYLVLWITVTRHLLSFCVKWPQKCDDFCTQCEYFSQTVDLHSDHGSGKITKLYLFLVYHW